MSILIAKATFIYALCLICATCLFASDLSNLRSEPHGYKPGNYELVLRASNPIIDAGDHVTIQVFITGYGDIHSPRFIFYPSPGLCDTPESKVKYGFQYDHEKNQFFFGTKTNPFDEYGFSISFGGIGFGEEPTMFFDSFDRSLGKEPPSPLDYPRRLSTEMVYGTAPVEISLATKPDAIPGLYDLRFYFSYFNGNIWKTSKERVSITLRNRLQRHELAVAIVASIAAFLTILSLFANLVKQIRSACNYFKNKTSLGQSTKSGKGESLAPPPHTT